MRPELEPFHSSGTIIRPLRKIHRIALFCTWMLATAGLPAAQGIRIGTFSAEVRTFFAAADGLPEDSVSSILILDGQVYADTAKGAARFSGGRWMPVPAMPAVDKPALDGLEVAAGAQPQVRQVAVADDGRVAVALAEGLALRTPSGKWIMQQPRDATHSWALHDVRGAAFDSRGRLWFASPQGVGCLENEWALFTPSDGLPYDDFTTVVAGEAGVVWFGTRKGAIRFDGRNWEYRQGLRWLPHDEVRSIAVGADGTAWLATPAGVARIERRPITLKEKAAFFEAEIDKRHRRTPYGYVLGVSLKRPGDTREWAQHDSDNDGLWTAMYGAGQCFAYAATRSPDSKRRAEAAFKALRFLGQVTQGGSPPAPKGFVARTVLPASGPDPNGGAYTRERDEQARDTRDRLWKVIVPRWPKSADGQWYWKSDTSSDELDGHYFFYALYYDLVASTPEEKQPVREHVAALTDHLVSHNFQLVDHDGKPTRWGVFDPENLNHNPDWREERGLNSLSILAYLKVGEHITGNAKYGEAAGRLIREHAYDMNVLIPKTNAGPGSGNQSDDEMAFMNFYHLIRYEADPRLKSVYALAFWSRWNMERPELNPLFNFLHAAVNTGLIFSDAFGKQELSPSGNWLEESVDCLRRYPLDRVNWRMTNSHRRDLLPLPDYVREGGTAGLGFRINGRVLPIDERFVEHWNHDPWQLDQGGDGRQLADGNSFLLPYYLGLYHRFIVE